jgi:predicted RND superfamily exporter protein
MLVVDELENAIIEKASKNKDFKKYELSLKPYIARLKQNLVHTAGQQKPQWAKIIEANDDAPVKMRSKPKKSATLIASIPIDATVKILETTETHAKVTYEENTGWILKQVGGKPLYALTSSSSMAFAGTNITLFGVILLFGMLIWYYRNSVQYWWKQLA